ncbi:MAG: HDOD domain-containing protein [Candidatus Xenobiia bacterium LiM19]
MNSGRSISATKTKKACRNAPDLIFLGEKVKELDTLPSTYYRISRLIEDPRCSANEIGRLISHDQVIACKVLKIANSAFYGFPSRIDSIPRAVSVIGFSAIRELILATSVIDIFLKQNNGSVFDRQEFWKHSLGCAIAAKITARYTGKFEIEELFTAGLIHDIGKVIIDQCLTDFFITIMSMTDENKNLTFSEAEQKVLGYTHADVGALVARKWGLPNLLVETISFHHTLPDTMKNPKQVAVIHIANSIAKALRLGDSGYRKVPPIDAKAREILEIKAAMLELIAEETLKEFHELIRIFS